MPLGGARLDGAVLGPPLRQWRTHRRKAVWARGSQSRTSHSLWQISGIMRVEVFRTRVPGASYPCIGSSFASLGGESSSAAGGSAVDVPVEGPSTDTAAPLTCPAPKVTNGSGAPGGNGSVVLRQCLWFWAEMSLTCESARRYLRTLRCQHSLSGRPSKGRRSPRSKDELAVGGRVEHGVLVSVLHSSDRPFVSPSTRSRRWH